MIDWQLLVQRLDCQAPFSPGELRTTRLTGGSINQAYRLESGASRYFVKLNRVEPESMFVAERRGLETIRGSGAIRVPEVYLTGREGQISYIVMEYIEMAARAESDCLARSLAAMHSCTRDSFGFAIDNTIGSTLQVNQQMQSWTEFWRSQRLGFQLALAERNGLPKRLIDSGSRLAQQLDGFFDDYQPMASLLHGDLWSGNRGADEEGNPVIFDPACYFGDHEADLAMMELFGNPGARFFATYNEHFSIDAGYSSRRDLYNLYHLLNHANLFGGGYADQAQRVIDDLLSLLH